MRKIFKLRISWAGAAVVAFLMLIGIIIVPRYIRARSTSRKNACINNLRLIECTKLQWTMEQRKKATDIPTERELWAGFWRGYAEFNEAGMPTCPDDPSNSFKSSYRTGSVVELPICLIDPKNHILPQHGAADWDYIHNAWAIVDAANPSNNSNSSSGPFSNRPSGGR